MQIFKENLKSSIQYLHSQRELHIQHRQHTNFSRSSFFWRWWSQAVLLRAWLPCHKPWQHVHRDWNASNDGSGGVEPQTFSVISSLDNCSLERLPISSGLQGKSVSLLAKRNQPQSQGPHLQAHRTSTMWSRQLGQGFERVTSTSSLLDGFCVLYCGRRRRFSFSIGIIHIESQRQRLVSSILNSKSRIDYSKFYRRW